MWYFGLAAAGGRPATPDVTHASAAIAPPAASPAEPAAQATGFVGDDTCVACHEPEGKGLHLTLHGKPRAGDRLADGASGAGAHVALAGHRHEHGERVLRFEAARPQPGLRVRVRGQHVEQRAAPAVHDQQRAGVARARSPDSRRHGARDGDELPVHVASGEHGVVQRPLPAVEFDNRTVPFDVINGVNYDTAVVALNKESEPFSRTRRTLDADATYSPWRHVGFRAGYTREDVDRTFRIVEKTLEDTGRASVDLTGVPWVTVRGVFEHSKRRGSAVNGLELLAIGEQPTLREYDISDRDQDRCIWYPVLTGTARSPRCAKASTVWSWKCARPSPDARIACSRWA